MNCHYRGSNKYHTNTVRFQGTVKRQGTYQDLSKSNPHHLVSKMTDELDGFQQKEEDQVTNMKSKVLTSNA